MSFETKRLQSQKLCASDFEKVHALQTNPQVMKYLGEGKPRNRAEVQRLFDKLLRHQEVHGYSLWRTYEKATGAFIGFSGLVHLALDDTQPEVEVGYWLLPEFWGRGYAT